VAARLDVDAVLRSARHHVRWHERDADASSLELSLLPNGAVLHAVLHLTDADDFACCSTWGCTRRA
jgi:adenylosuccinate lyase